MSAPEQIDVAYVAQLARMSLSSDEKELFQRQLSDVLHYIEKLRQVDVSQVEAATHAIPVFNVFREDDSPGLFYRGRSVIQRAAESATTCSSFRKLSNDGRSFAGLQHRRPAGLVAASRGFAPGNSGFAADAN